HHARHAGTHQGVGLHARRDRGRLAARIAGARVSRTPQGEHAMTTSALPATSLAAIAATAAHAAPSSQPGSAPLTRVSLAYIEPRFKLYLRFGEPARTLQLDRWRRCAMFLPG